MTENLSIKYFPGGLRENAEAFVEGRLSDLSDMLRMASITPVLQGGS